MLYSIGTKGKTVPWSNPCVSGEVTCAWSSVYDSYQYKVESLVSRPPEQTWSDTTSKPNSWMAVDLGPQRRLVVNHYALRDGARHGYTPRNWELQGAESMEGEWTTLRRHDNDESLDETKSHAEASWAVEGGGSVSFRCFRVLQHGMNASRGYEDYLCCAGIELYSVLTGAR